MPAPVLVTKLFVPTRRASAVQRSRLLARLDEGRDRILTLVCAPAGFGKTTLVAAWAATAGRAVAWLSLDERDADPARFVTYLLAALRTVAPELGERWPDPAGTAPESLLVAVLNDLSSWPDPIVLVLDDYHAAEARGVDEAVAFLLEHRPPQLQVVLSTREDPDLSLARLRARGELVEVRAGDLRFTATEAAEYLNASMNLSLSAGDVATLETRTEGWIAGLQLAALSMRGQENPSAFIEAFAGDHRYIADYLVGEVLDRQPEDVRTFLLRTSVLDRMSGDLCDAVTGQAGGGARLDALDRGNFFVVPLDENRRWYRYHHLFAEVLRAYLRDDRPEDVADLHRRASGWFERNDAPGDAIRHALAAQDFARAADLVELAATGLHRLRQEATLLGWLRALPDEVLDNRPMLSALYAATLLISNEYDEVDARLSAAERWITAEGALDPAAVVVDRDELRRLPASLALWRAGLAHVSGDAATTEVQARRAQELAGGDDRTNGSAEGLLGLVCWARGDLDGAFAHYTECQRRLGLAGFVTDVVGCTITVAELRLAQGRLREAIALYDEGLRRATAGPGPVLRGAADMHVGLSDLHRRRGDLAVAADHLALAHELGDIAGMPQNPYRRRAAEAALRYARGDTEGAIALLDEAERVYTTDFGPHVRPVPAMRARLWVRQGRVSDAAAWARDVDVCVDDELSYVREYEHITLARVLLAQHDAGGDSRPLTDAIGLLQRLLRAAEQGGRVGSVIEVLVLQALAHRTAGDTQAARAALVGALDLAAPEGHVQVFIDEGSGLSPLLVAAAEEHAYARDLLAAATPTVAVPVQRQPLVDPLSDRELEVLRLLRSDLDGPGIARELVVSLHTVRSHTKSIYTKLGVNSRREAVRQAERLELLPISGRP